MIESILEFKEEIQKLKNEFSLRHSIMYRGQCNHTWKLQSSLERHGTELIDCKDYYRIIDRYKPLINPLIDNRFERKATLGGYPFNFTEYDKASFELPEMEYLTYLRHHGFPTPLIDFSRSCYIALFFACEDFNQNNKVDGKIFVYSPHFSNYGGTDVPALRKIGRYVEAGKRHIAQQSEYLVPLEYIKDEWKFITFKKVTEDTRNEYAPKEILISKDAKAYFMKELNEMNINRYTLYLNEDALIKSLADDWALEKIG